MYKNVFIINHPLIKHKLTHIREKETSTKEFREYLKEISSLMAYEALKEISLKEIKIQTPIAETVGYEIEKTITIFPILRAGQGMVDGFLQIVPSTKVAHIGIYRDEKSLEPIEYLFKYPKDCSDGINIIIDPMLATGGTILHAITMLNKIGVTDIIIIAIVASKFAIEKIATKYPKIKIYVAAIDEELNNKGYIVPGLGDAGDRIFGTK